MRTASFEAEVLADLLDGADDEGVEDFADEAIAEAKGYADEDTDYIGEVARNLTRILMTMAGQLQSHGERSRVYFARALLQDAQLTVLDESFAALDPETLKKCLNCAVKRARTLLVIAHP